MIEEAVAERFIFRVLSSIGATYGIPVERLPVGKTELSFPFLAWSMVASRDVNAIGLGNRLGSTFEYEICVVHDGRTLGAEFKTTTGTVTLLQLFAAIDSGFQDNATPETYDIGTMLSCRRVRTSRLPFSVGGRFEVREGGIYRIRAKAA